MDEAIFACSWESHTVSLCLTFGGTPHPNLWSFLADPFTDIANRLNCYYWMGSQHLQWLNVIFNITSSGLSGWNQTFWASTAFNHRRSQKQNIGKIDLYIHNNTTTSLGIKDSHKRVSAAIILAIQSLTRPLVDNESLSRKSDFQLESPQNRTEAKDWEIESYCLSFLICFATFLVDYEKHFKDPDLEVRRPSEQQTNKTLLWWSISSERPLYKESLSTT